MPRQGLTRETVIRTAIEMIDSKGVASFSMVALAKALHVKTASLYNHIESLEALYSAVALSAIAQMVQAEETAVAGKSGDAALWSLASAYRGFAREHYHLYRFILAALGQDNPELEQAAAAVIQPILRILSGYGLCREQQVHWQRILRSVMHGFVAHETAGGFSHFPIGSDESYRLAIQWITAAVAAAGKDGEHERG